MIKCHDEKFSSSFLPALVRLLFLCEFELAELLELGLDFEDEDEEVGVGKVGVGGLDELVLLLFLLLLLL
jgi:hypothetical protein